MLGQTQRDGLTNGIINSSALWKVWGNEVFTAPLKLGTVFFNLDAWDGYEAERKLIMQKLLNASIKNFIVLTGDLHSYTASYLKANYDIPQNSDNFLGIYIRNMVGSNS
jgi:alkaline phosphatase D